MVLRYVCCKMDTNSLGLLIRQLIFRKNSNSYGLWSDIWNVSYIELRIWNQASHDHRSFERNLSNCEQKPEKVRTSTGFDNVFIYRTLQIPLRFMVVNNSFFGGIEIGRSACKGAAGSRYQSLVDLIHSTHVCLWRRDRRPDHNTLGTPCLTLCEVWVL